jgi:hypothetical protein
MKIEIHVSDDRKRYSISVDGSAPEPMENFLLLTREGETMRNVVFGDVETVGRLLFGFYVNCWRFDETGMRGVLELVAEDIRDLRDRREQLPAEPARKAV